MAAEAVLTELDEFLAEVDADRSEIAREIVRLTKQATPIMDGTITRITVDAGYRVSGEIVRFRTLVGDLWGTTSSRDREVQDAARQLILETRDELA